MAETKEFLNYKGFPLVRCKDILYYGNTSDKYVVKFEVIESEKNGDVMSATKVKVDLLDADTLSDKKVKSLKTSEKNGLYEAMDIGAIWLNRQLGEK